MKSNFSLFKSPSPFPIMNEKRSTLEIFRLTLSSVIFLATLLANVAAIVYIYKHKQLRSIKNYYYGYYLINLNIADLLVALFCIPITLIYYNSKTWTFGSFICKLIPSIQVVSVSASICTLAMITWERYKAIVYPMTPRSAMLGLRIKILLIWAWALVVAAPSFYAYEYNSSWDKFQCREAWPSHYQRQTYTIFIFAANYAIPLGFILFSYAIIVIRLKLGFTPYSERTTKLLQNQFIKLMVLLITSFAICYLPIHICFFIMDFGAIANRPIFSIVLKFSHVLTWVNSCLNPFFYCILNGYLKKLTARRNVSTNQEVRETSEVHNQDSLRKLLERHENENRTLTCNRTSKFSASSRQTVESYI